jgi:hypothetical protein
MAKCPQNFFGGVPLLARKADEVGRVQGFFLITSMFGVLCLLVAVVTWMWGHS